MGIHFQYLGHFHFHGGIRGAHLQAGQVFHLGHRAVDGHEVAVAVFGVHDRLQADVVGDLCEVLAQLARIDGFIQLFLILGAGDVRQVKDLIERREIGHIGSGTHGHFQAALLGALHQHAVAAQNGVGEDLDFDLAAALLLHQFL